MQSFKSVYFYYYYCYNSRISYVMHFCSIDVIVDDVAMRKCESKDIRLKPTRKEKKPTHILDDDGHCGFIFYYKCM